MSNWEIGLTMALCGTVNRVASLCGCQPHMPDVRHTHMKILTPLIFFCLVSTSTFAVEITGMFSSFRLSEQSGDIVGMEIHIVPDPIGYSAIVQGSEGAPGFPKAYSITRNGNIIIFTVPKASGTGLAPGKYKGTVSSKDLRLRGPYKSYVLPRKSSYWQ